MKAKKWLSLNHLCKTEHKCAFIFFRVTFYPETLKKVYIRINFENRYSVVLYNGFKHRE